MSGRPRLTLEVTVDTLLLTVTRLTERRASTQPTVGYIPQQTPQLDTVVPWRITRSRRSSVVEAWSAAGPRAGRPVHVLSPADAVGDADLFDARIEGRGDAGEL